MKYGEIFHELKAKQVFHSISHATSMISDLAMLSMAAMAMHMLNLP